MEISVLVKHAIENSTDDLTVEINETTTIPDLFDMVNIPWGDFSDYYRYSSMYYYNRETLPFLLVDKQIQYDVAFTDARIIDFIDTHQIDVSNDKLRVLTGYPMAGGLGAPDVVALWNCAFPILKDIAIGLIVQFACEIIKKICSLFKKRNKAPNIIFDIVYTRKQWNHHELAEYLDIEPENAKSILKLLGYEYDRKKMAYIQGEHIEEIQNKLQQLPPIDC